MEDIKVLRDSVPNWSLASDMKLLDMLRDYSMKIAYKSTILIKKIDDLAIETVESETKLRNTFNEFLMMSNTQFIENVSIFI